MHACHLLLGRPWMFDRNVINYGRTNSYSLVMNGVRYTLAPLSPREVYEDQKMLKSRMDAYEKEIKERESAHEKEKVHKQKESRVENNERSEPRVVKGELKEGLRKSESKKSMIA